MRIAVKKTKVCILIIVIACGCKLHSNGQVMNDSNTPLHLLKPEYKTPSYGVTKPEDVKKVIDRVRTYLEATTPAEIINSKTGVVITDYSKPIPEAILKPGDYRLTGYEWGVTFTGMMQAGANTGDKSYMDYTATRMKFLANAAKYFTAFSKAYPDLKNPLRNMLDPHALDDAGSLCAAMIKSERAGISNTLRPVIDNYMNYIMTKEYRLSDETFARNRPLPNTLWLDDLYMSVPAIIQMGKLTGDKKYYDEAVKQVLQFSQRMFDEKKGLYMHGWVESMSVHPKFYWGRANGWALLTKIEVLDALPLDHPGRPVIMGLLLKHLEGLAAVQSGDGFWHQLLDRTDSYYETSATAIYSYCIAHAINQGWIDREAFAPKALLAWNAVSTKVTEKGQVEGTCVGTGMAFDPAFYYYRPVNVYAAHSYGPVLLAGAAMYKLLKEHPVEINDSAAMFPK
jgi:unsaturated rhamnogalacturonyl hydrolase